MKYTKPVIVKSEGSTHVTRDCLPHFTCVGGYACPPFYCGGPGLYSHD